MALLLWKPTIVPLVEDFTLALQSSCGARAHGKVMTSQMNTVCELAIAIPRCATLGRTTNRVGIV